MLFVLDRYKTLVYDPAILVLSPLIPLILLEKAEKAKLPFS